MRGARFLLAFLLALAGGACARQQPTYYVIDPATGQQVPVVQQYSQPQYAQTYGQPAYAAPPPVYSQAPEEQQAQVQTPASENRGLFTSRRAAPAYAPQPYAQPGYAPQQTYAAQPAPHGYVQQQQAPQGYTMQYRPPVAAAPAPAPAPQATYPQYGQYGYAYAPSSEPYTLDAGDRLRIVVFGQDGITGSYMVDAGGSVNLPLIGAVPARGFSTQALSKMIGERLKQGYVRDPSVTVEIEQYRPFFILGEVTAPGQYPYVANMTVEKAVAIAGGFGPRASKKTVQLTRNANGQQFRGEVPLNYPLKPGDTIQVKERWF